MKFRSRLILSIHYHRLKYFLTSSLYKLYFFYANNQDPIIIALRKTWLHFPKIHAEYDILQVGYQGISYLNRFLLTKREFCIKLSGLY